MAKSFVYILERADNSFYVGSTKCLVLRFWEHCNNEAGAYTFQRLPVRLVYVEIFTRIDHAFEREHQKNGQELKKKR